MKLILRQIGGTYMKSNGKCIWEYCNEKCECSECVNCPHYRPDYVADNKSK